VRRFLKETGAHVATASSGEAGWGGDFCEAKLKKRRRQKIMEFYDMKDLEYWKRQADEGRAVIIEIPVEMLLDMDIDALSRQNVKPKPDRRARRAAGRKPLQTEESVEMQQLQMQMGLSGESGNVDGRADNHADDHTDDCADDHSGDVAKGKTASTPVKTRPGIDMDELNDWIESHQEELQALGKKYAAQVPAIEEMERKLYGQAWTDVAGDKGEAAEHLSGTEKT